MGDAVQLDSLRDQYELSGSPNRGLSTGTMAFFAGFAAVAMFAITADRIAQILNLSIMEVGWLVAIPLVTGSFLRIPFSALVDRYGGKFILIVQLLIALTGLIGLVLVFSILLSARTVENEYWYYIILLFGALSGTGISVFSPGTAYVSYWFPQDRQGYALGVFGGFGNVAPAIFTVILPFLIFRFGIIHSYLIWTLFLLAVILLFAYYARNSYFFQLIKKNDPATSRSICLKAGQDVIPTGSSLGSLADSARRWRVWFLVLMYFTSFGGFEALTEWFPTYWQGFFQMSLVQSGILTGIVFSLVTAMTRVSGGIYSDRWGGEKISIVSYGTLVLGSVLVLLSHEIYLSVAGEIIMAVGMGNANAAVYKLVPKYSHSSVGGASGWVGGLGSAGGLVIPPVLAEFVSFTGNGGYSMGFSVFVILGTLSLALSLTLMSRGFPEFSAKKS